MTSRSRSCWQWFEGQLGLLGGRQRRRLRRAQWDDSPVAAQVETLESRLLLTVTYNGGDIITNVNAQAVYIGSQWADPTNATLQNQETQTDQFLQTLVNSSFMNMLTNAGYGVGLGTASKGAVDNVALNTTSGITDAQIQADIQAMIKAGTVQAPTANQLYVVYVEPGIVIHLGSDSSATTFLGYHGAFSGTNASNQQVDIHYAVVSYPGAPNFTAQSQGFSSNMDEMTAVASHEVAESVTDANVNYKTLGWYDATFNGEIGDLAEGNYTRLAGYLVQDMVNQNDQIIAPSTAQVTPTNFVAAPTVTATSVNSTTAHLSWTADSNALDYNVYYINGQITVFLGTVGAGTTSVNVNNLPSGSNASFMVMAYNATDSASSSVVSVTLTGSGGGGGGGGGGSTGLAAPRVQAFALDSTDAVLAWNQVSGAQGYRIFLLEGNNQRVLLGTVGARSTAVLISGMSPGTTYHFVVEAFNSTSVADSAVVTVTTPFRAATLDQVATWAALAGNPANPSQWLVGADFNHHHTFG